MCEGSARAFQGAFWQYGSRDAVMLVVGSGWLGSMTVSRGSRMVGSHCSSSKSTS